MISSGYPPPSPKVATQPIHATTLSNASSSINRRLRREKVLLSARRLAYGGFTLSMKSGAIQEDRYSAESYTRTFGRHRGGRYIAVGFIHRHVCPRECHIEWNVTDITGAIIPGAAIMAANDTTGMATTRVTNELGEYEFTLQPGLYTITVEAPGFETGIYSNVEVRGRPTGPAKLYSRGRYGRNEHRGRDARGAPVGDRVDSTG